jgi:hypothetical protein
MVTKNEFIKSLSTANTPDSQWGLVGIAAGFLLFAPPLVFYFFDKGGFLMLPSWVWITFGMIVSVVWIAVLIVGILIFRRWWMITKTKDEAKNNERNKP